MECYEEVKVVSTFSALLVMTLSLCASRTEPVWKAQPGPWGDLEVRTVYLEVPDTLLAAVSKPNAVTRWVFEQTTESAVRELLVRQGGLRDDGRSAPRSSQPDPPG